MKQTPYALAAAVTLLMCLVQLALIWHSTHGAVLFTLDDPYIHLALARQLATHGHYGINPGEFTAPSSSILYPLLLVPGIWLGAGQAWALAICVAATVATPLLALRILAAAGYRLTRIPSWALALLTASACGAFNLVGLAFTGMEHALHVAVCLGCVLGVVVFLNAGRVAPYWLACALLCPLVRFEGATFWLASAALLAAGGRWRASFGVLLAGAALLGGFSILLMAHGLSPLPNSVLVKTAFAEPAPADFMRGMLVAVVRIEAIAALLAAVLLLCVSRRGAAWLAAAGCALFLLAWLAPAIWPAVGPAPVPTGPLHPSGFLLSRLGAFGFVQMLALLALAGMALHRAVRRRAFADGGLAAFAVCVLGGHVVFAQFGWLNRYEIYALVSGALLVAAAYRQVCARVLAAAGPPQFVALPLVMSLLMCVYVFGQTRVARATQDIYLQQYQMARFVRDVWRAPVAVGDLGEVSYASAYYVLDLWGLASYESLMARTQATSPAWMQTMAQRHDVRLAMIHDRFFKHLPPSWVLAGTLSVRRPVVFLPSPDVSFYATSPEAAGAVRAALVQFARDLPEGVRVVVRG